MVALEASDRKLILLADNHNLAGFDSGAATLDSWLRDHAVTAARRGLSATHVWAQPDLAVVAFITLASHTLALEELPGKLGRGQPKWLPATLLAKLALHRDLQGQRLGGVLLLQALQLAAASARNVASAFVVVDAL